MQVDRDSLVSGLMQHLTKGTPAEGPRYRKIRKVTVLPFGTRGMDAKGRKIKRGDDGLWLVGRDKQPVSTLDLDYPLMVMR